MKGSTMDDLKKTHSKPLANPRKRRRGPKKNYQNKCLVAAFDAISEIYETNPESDLHIVHGWLGVDTAGPWYLHAWCELDNMVYDYTKQREPFEKDEFYKSRNVSEIMKRYSALEYFKLGAKYIHYGPFDKIFILMGMTSLINPSEQYEFIRKDYRNNKGYREYAESELNRNK